MSLRTAAAPTEIFPHAILACCPHRFRGSRLLLNTTTRTLFIWIAIFIVVILLWNNFQGRNGDREELTFTEFLEQVEKQQVMEVTLQEGKVTGTFKGGGQYVEGQTFSTQAPDYPDLVQELRTNGVDITAEPPRDNPMLAIFLTEDEGAKAAARKARAAETFVPQVSIGRDIAGGALAMSAMILPGISGAYMMLILGRYEHITGSVSLMKDVVRGDTEHA
ncbi:MAG: ATP-dependent metallopeptidase FtsH/Yme1/Tma family protein, partial [Pseudomonadota bacterium]